jgi:hypothetical protein
MLRIKRANKSNKPPQIINTRSHLAHLLFCVCVWGVCGWGWGSWFAVGLCGWFCISASVTNLSGPVAQSMRHYNSCVVNSP